MFKRTIVATWRLTCCTLAPPPMPLLFNIVIRRVLRLDEGRKLQKLPTNASSN